MRSERTGFSTRGGRTTPPSSRFNSEELTEPPPRDWKRTVLIIGLGALSWVATYVGMLELIEANMGELPFAHRIIIAFSVAMLMIMIVWLLDQMFKPQPFLTKVLYVTGYVFLTLISAGFGFGFYWKVLESRGEASRSAESAVSQVQNSLYAASTRLEQLQSTLVSLTGVSTSKAELERSKGTSCPNSKPGDGPRRKMRDEDAQRFTFASEFVKGRVAAVKGDMTALDADLVKIASADASTFDAKTGTRNEFMKGLGRRLDLTVTGFNAFRTDPQLRQIRSDLADRAERTTVTDARGASVSCPDPQLQAALRGVVKAIDQLPELSKPEIAAVEGSEATIEAFRRLTTTFFGMLAFKLPPTADELRDLQKKAVQSAEGPPEPGAPGAAQAIARSLNGEQAGLSKRDYVPLAVALFVDLCLFLVSMVQRPVDRFASLAPKMRAAERGPVIQILSRFNEIHRDQQIRENFELFRHVVFDMNGDYYVAVPLDAPPRLNPAQREDLRVEAQLLANLFASFEKEKIFKRTLLPTTGSIQKRLARQGSKFAGAEAFRVYKFADGAWSDIILGAVMGAARRVEEQNLATEPPDSDSVAPASPNPAPVAAVMTAYRRPAANAAARSRRSATPAEKSFEPSLSLGAENESRASRRSAADVDTDHASRFGPYADRYRPEPPPFATAPQGPRVPWPAPPPLPEADVTVKAANSNSLRPLPESETNESHDAIEDSQISHVAPIPRWPSVPRAAATAAAPDADEPRVILSRETATLSVPVSAAMMPVSLQSAITRLGAASPHSAVADHTTEGRGSKRIADTNGDDDDFSARDMALIGRMAPPAAE